MGKYKKERSGNHNQNILRPIIHSFGDNKNLFDENIEKLHPIPFIRFLRNKERQ